MAKKENAQELNDRARDILKGLIQEYVRTGKPVGSRRLAKINREGLSAATIRNIMSDLEEGGFVAQPHTSAGRIPAEKGYRFYVDALLYARELPSKEAERISRSLEQETDPGELMTKTSQILSEFSNNVGFVLAPPVSLAVLKHIEFLNISERRVLVVLVTRAGLVQHRLIQIDEELSQGELEEAGRYLVKNFEGRTLFEIRDELLALMSEEKALYDRLLKNVILLGSASLVKAEAETPDSPEVYIGGTAKIITRPELADVNRMIALFQTFEQKSRLVKIISECLKITPGGPTVTIGLDKHLPAMRDWAVVASPYLYNNQVWGSLGILGPARMEYARAISLVDYVAKLFGKILSTN